MRSPGAIIGVFGLAFAAATPALAQRTLDREPFLETGGWQPERIAPPVRLELEDPEEQGEDREPPRERPTRRQPGFGYGLQVVGGYSADSDMSMYGLSGVIRYSFLTYLALELDFGLNGVNADALMVPMSLNGLVFLRLRGLLHPYFLWGGNLTVLDQFEGDETMVYGGAHFGLGMERVFRRGVAVTLDLRTFFQERLTPVDDLEYGVTLNYGLVFYR